MCVINSTSSWLLPGLLFRSLAEKLGASTSWRTTSMAAFAKLPSLHTSGTQTWGSSAPNPSNGLEQPSEAALAQCLNSMIDLPGQIPTYIIIDALDECPDNIETPSAREKVLDFIEDLVQSNHSNLFVRITSRPEQDINTALYPLTPPSRRVYLHKGSQMEDINSFARSFVMNNRTMRRRRAEDKEIVIRELSEQDQGM